MSVYEVRNQLEEAQKLTTSQAVHLLPEGVLAQRLCCHSPEPWSLPPWREVRGLTPVTAWASQTGKGLLFFNKKGESDRTQPAGVIPLYEATDLKKASPHEFTFEISGHKHSFKASNDAERDGWYQSIEKSIELGKASKESVRDNESYKTEIEKLSMFLNDLTNLRAMC